MDSASVAKMLATIAHRGPDDEGIFSSVDGRVVLAHRRLAIVDVGQAGHQPMQHGRLHVVFNGEIYNYRELAEELRNLGHSFKTRTDTEVILHAYQEWGRNCLLRFVGMWAFAIYDESSDLLFFARDPFGIKPLYYSVTDTLFCFASEPKAILQLASRQHVDYTQLASYLVLGITDHGESTFFRSIRQLLPGCWLTVSKGGVLQHGRYFDLLGKLQKTRTTSIDDFRRALDRSVRLHLRSDVPVGTCLSGGLDSSAISSTASHMYRQERGEERFMAITAGSEDAGKDERRYAGKVAEWCGLDWHSFVPTYTDFSRELSRSLWHQDEPVGSPSVFMQYSVMRMARSLGLKVLLDGQGGDELLLGYERYHVPFLAALVRHNWWRVGARELMASGSPRLNLAKLAAHFGYLSFPSVRASKLLRKHAWLRGEFVEYARPLVSEMLRCQSSIRDIQIADVLRFNLPSLLRYEDRNSMAHGIEARVPFIEPDVMVTALALSMEDKVRDGYTKYALRRAMAGRLPDAITWRRNKIGFEAPTKLWLDSHSEKVSAAVAGSAILRGIVVRMPLPGQCSPAMMWRLYNVALWEQMFEVAT